MSRIYCIVVHTSGRCYTLDRSYRLLDESRTDHEQLLAHVRESDKWSVAGQWDGWTPSSDQQKPEWARTLPSNEFKAYWIDERKTVGKLLSHEEAFNSGFAKFNGGPHLCVDVPNGHFTISVRTSEGKRLTFAFCPYEQDGPPQCVDVQHHSEQRADNGSPIQKVICFTPGRHVFSSKPDDATPITLTTVILQ